MPRRPLSPARAPVVRPSLEAFRKASPGEILTDLLTFDRLLTGPVIHLIYWAGLALIVLGGFVVVGGAVGLALNEPGWLAWVLAIPTVVVGLLVLFIVAMLWRSFCELYVALFQIAADLKIMRAYVEQDHAPPRGDP
ncbi:DUF4282 domain-containing protein [Brevundimonas sp.]|uniref:DUF4282 domain-containing protein n=1 Tax=Brevundimonas sp. TaxID=1871086 RepID=UPI001DDA3601|nr:DUF4282 domain-containing protein [Brevundimonas sp.]MBA4000975.1 hypothetical protein [Brevundimonas sp.]